MPSASDLDERVKILFVSTSKDEYGEVTETYSVDRTVPAGVQVRAGAERRIGGRPEERATVIVRVRKGAAEGITQASRLRYDGDDLQVHARRKIGRHHRFIELETSRVRDGS